MSKTKEALTEQDIERIVSACGYAYSIHEEMSGRGDGKSKRYVMARMRGERTVKRSLGRIEKVQQLSQNELVKLIESKFKKGDETG